MRRDKQAAAGAGGTRKPCLNPNEIVLLVLVVGPVLFLLRFRVVQFRCFHVPTSLLGVTSNMTCYPSIRLATQALPHLDLEEEE